MKASPMVAQTAHVNGMEMYYEVRGHGEPLILLHGFTGCGADWNYIFKDSPQGYQLVVPNLRGHGRSTNPSMMFTHQQAALDVFALLDQLSIERFKAIGVSCGAKTLLHLATQQPRRVEAMVLVSATTHFPKQARALMSRYTVDDKTDEEWQLMRQRHKHGDEQIRSLWRQCTAFKDSYDDMNFTPDLLFTITARTLIVHGDRDPFYPVHIPVEMYNSIPRSYLSIIPNGGHGPIFGNLTGHFLETALSFLRGDWDST